MDRIDLMYFSFQFLLTLKIISVIFIYLFIDIHFQKARKILSNRIDKSFSIIINN